MTRDFSPLIKRLLAGVSTFQKQIVGLKLICNGGIFKEFLSTFLTNDYRCKYLFGKMGILEICNNLES